MEPPVAKRKKPDTEATRRARLDKRNEIERARRLTESDEQRKARLAKRNKRDRARRNMIADMIYLAWQHSRQKTLPFLLYLLIDPSSTMQDWMLLCQPPAGMRMEAQRVYSIVYVFTYNNFKKTRVYGSTANNAVSLARPILLNERFLVIIPD